MSNLRCAGVTGLAALLAAASGALAQPGYPTKPIWLDDKLVYNVTGNDEGEKFTKESSLSFKFYPGSETQNPDPTIQAIKGANNVPGYRGLCYLVLKNLKLSDYGNRLPIVRVLIGKGSARAPGMFPVQVAWAGGYN